MRSSTTHIPDIELDFLLSAYAVPPFLSFVCHLIGEREREKGHSGFLLQSEDREITRMRMLHRTKNVNGIKCIARERL